MTLDRKRRSFQTRDRTGVLRQRTKWSFHRLVGQTESNRECGYVRFWPILLQKSVGSTLSARAEI